MFTESVDDGSYLNIKCEEVTDESKMELHLLNFTRSMLPSK